MFVIQRMARAPGSLLLAAPAGAWLVSRLLFEAAEDLSRGEPTVWGGRAYLREDRSTGKPRQVGTG
jgi:hypothetical protein